MTSICVQKENVFYIPFLVLLHSHLQEQLHSARLAAIISSADAHVHESPVAGGYWPCCEAEPAQQQQPSLAEGGSPGVYQGRHSLGWPLGHQRSKEHQKVICEVTAIKHTDPDNSHACELAKRKTWGREDKSKWKWKILLCECGQLWTVCLLQCLEVS